MQPPAYGDEYGEVDEYGQLVEYEEEPEPPKRAFFLCSEIDSLTGKPKPDALHSAIVKGDEAQAIHLIEGGVEMGYRDQFGYSLLHVAAFQGDGLAFAFAHCPTCMRRLTRAFRAGCHAIVRSLLEHGADVNATDQVRASSRALPQHTHCERAARLSARGRARRGRRCRTRRAGRPTSTTPPPARAAGTGRRRWTHRK